MYAERADCCIHSVYGARALYPRARKVARDGARSDREPTLYVARFMPPSKTSAWANIKPKSILTWVRIRPLASEGEKGGHGEGKAVEKQLGEFNETPVNIQNHDQKGKVSSYDYMSKVFPTDISQDGVGKEILPGLLADFWGERNVMIFAAPNRHRQDDDNVWIPRIAHLRS